MSYQPSNEVIRAEIAELGRQVGGKLSFNEEAELIAFHHKGVATSESVDYEPKLGVPVRHNGEFVLDGLDMEEWFKDPRVQEAIDLGDSAILSPGGNHEHSWESFLKRGDAKSLSSLVKKGLTSKFDTMSVVLENTSASLVNVGGTFAIESAAIVNANIQVAAASRAMGIAGKQATYPNLAANVQPEHEARIKGLADRIAAIAFAAINMYESDDALGGATGGNAATLAFWFGYPMGIGKKVKTAEGEKTITLEMVGEWAVAFADASYKERVAMAKETLMYSYAPRPGIDNTIAHCFVLTKRATELENPSNPANRESSDKFNPFNPDDQIDVLSALVGFFRRFAQGLDEAKKFDAGEALRFVEYLTTCLYFKETETGKLYDFEEGYDDCTAPPQTEVVVIEQLEKLLKGADGNLTPFGEFISRNLKIAALHAQLADVIVARGKKAEENESAKKKFMEESMITMVRKRTPRRLRSAQDVLH